MSNKTEMKRPVFKLDNQMCKCWVNDFRLLGLVVWFPFRVREVAGSIPAAALNFDNINHFINYFYTKSLTLILSLIRKKLADSYIWDVASFGVHVTDWVEMTNSRGRHLWTVECLVQTLVGASFGHHEVVLKHFVFKCVHFWLRPLSYFWSVVVHVLNEARLIIVQVILFTVVEESGGSVDGVGAKPTLLHVQRLALIRKRNLVRFSVNWPVAWQLGPGVLVSVLVQRIRSTVCSGFTSLVDDWLCSAHVILGKTTQVHCCILHRGITVVSDVTIVQLLVIRVAEVYASLVVHRIWHSSLVYSVLPQLVCCLSFGDVSVGNVSPQESIQASLMNAVVWARVEELIGCSHHICVRSVTVVVISYFEHLVVVWAIHVWPQILWCSRLMNRPISIKPIFILIERIELARNPATLV